MAFDPSVISSIADNAPDPTASTAKAYNLADMIDTQQLRKGELAKQKTEAADAAKVKSVLQGSDLSTYEGKLKAGEAITKINPKMGMDFQKETQAGRAQEGELTRQQYEIYAAKNDLIGGAVVNLKTEHDALQNAGKSPAEINAAMMPKMMQTLQQLEAAKLPDGTPVLNAQDRQTYEQNLGKGYNPAFIDSLAARSAQARQVLTQRLAQRKEDNTEKRTEIADRQEAERERHDQAGEKLGRDKLERTAGGGLTDKSAAMLAEQVEAGDTSALTGLKPVDKVKVRNLMADNAQIRGTTGADQAAANANYQGVKAGERTLGQRQANIDMAVNEAQNIVPILREASAKVPRGAFTGWNKLIQAADNADSDPDLLAFAQAAKSYANIYTRATVPGASSVFDREEAVKHLPIFTSPESFNRVLDIMDKEMAAAKKSPEQVRRSLGDAVTGRDQEGGGVTPLPGRPGQPQTLAGQNPPAAGGTGGWGKATVVSN